MTREEAHYILNDHMDKTNIYFSWQQRYAHFKRELPCIAETYEVFITGGMTPREFYEKAVDNIIAANTALGKLL